MKVYALSYSYSRERFEVRPVESDNLLEFFPGEWCESIHGVRGPILEKLFKTERGAWRNDPKDRYYPA